VVWRAAGRGIPCAILEQDAFPGLATRALARRVRHIYLGLPETAARLRPGPRTLVQVTGCPITPPDEALRATAPAALGLDPSRPVVLVTGGSQGSAALNEVVAHWLGSGRANGVQVLWATGTATHARYREWHRPPAVQVLEFLDPIAPAYAAATVAVTRAGMMTIAELCAWGIPAILVPLPTAAADHQTRNAAVMAETGAAIHLPQAQLTPGRLADEVDRLLQTPGGRREIAARALARGRPGATSEIVTLLESLGAGS